MEAEMTKMRERGKGKQTVEPQLRNYTHAAQAKSRNVII